VKRFLVVLIVAVATAIVFWTPDACACSRIAVRFKVRRNFMVTVRGRDGRVLEGISVKIVFAIPSHDLVAEQLSDKDGKVVFHDLMISDYWISAEHAGVSGTVAELLPVADDSGSEWISLKWPEGPIENAQGVAGHLLVGWQKAPLTETDVWLTDTVTGKEVGRTATDKQGRFSFSKQDPGLYVLHIEERRDCSQYQCKIKGRILVEVDPTSKSAEIQRYGLSMTSCGLGGIKDDGSLVLFE
jgi:hypothetical protein